jgi:hypothetical protein
MILHDCYLTLFAMEIEVLGVSALGMKNHDKVEVS